MGISKWNAGIIRPVAVAPTGPYQNSSAPGVWTLDQQAYWDKQNLWPTAGSVDPSLFIENLFSTYLYTGNGSTQTITNNIDLSGKGGLVWFKVRNKADSHWLYDTSRGVGYTLETNSTNASRALDGLTAFNSNGFSITQSSTAINGSGDTYVSWTFREQAKFFDVVTYTGDGTSVRSISHNLGSTPGFIIVKRMDATGDWSCYHRSLGVSGGYIRLNSTAAASGTAFSTPINSTVFSIESGAPASMNVNGGTYVAYLFAHDAGGFGLTGTDNVISCGSFTTDGGSSFTAVNLGYEPQWLLIKASSGTSNWTIVDNMRGIPVGSNGARLIANLSDAETSTFSWANLTATGFSMPTGGTNPYSPSTTYIYIAIRRGPMKTPTSGTSVFSPNVPTGFTQFTTGFPVDLGMWNYTPGYSENTVVNDRLRGVSSTNSVTNANNLITSSTVAEQASQGTRNWNNTGLYAVTSQAVFYSFGRAPGFFDMVCYTGTGSAQTQSHNLGVAPELLIVKSRDSAINWVVWASAPTPQQNQYALNLNTAGTWGSSGDDIWGATLTGAPNMTSTTFSLGSYVGVNGSAKTYVAYLFASCPGVSKVGSYTGTGALQTINCGFAAGARFVLIKRTDSTGDWWVYDSARGITSGNDPYLFLNSTAAEVTNTNYVDTASTGFQVTAAAPAGLNANGGTYIFLAIS